MYNNQQFLFAVVTVISMLFSGVESDKNVVLWIQNLREIGWGNCDDCSTTLLNVSGTPCYPRVKNGMGTCNGVKIQFCATTCPSGTKKWNGTVCESADSPCFAFALPPLTHKDFLKVDEDGEFVNFTALDTTVNERLTLENFEEGKVVFLKVTVHIPANASKRFQELNIYNYVYIDHLQIGGQGSIDAAKPQSLFPRLKIEPKLWSLECATDWYDDYCGTLCRDGKKYSCNSHGEKICKSNFYPTHENLYFCSEHLKPEIIDQCSTYCSVDEAFKNEQTCRSTCYTDPHGDGNPVCRECGPKGCHIPAYIRNPNASITEDDPAYCVKQLCTKNTDPKSKTNCYHNGKCKNVAENVHAQSETGVFYKCKCNAGFEGPFCENQIPTTEAPSTTTPITPSPTTTKATTQTTSTAATTETSTSTKNSPTAATTESPISTAPPTSEKPTTKAPGDKTTTPHHNPTTAGPETAVTTSSSASTNSPDAASTGSGGGTHHEEKGKSKALLAVGLTCLFLVVFAVAGYIGFRYYKKKKCASSSLILDPNSLSFRRVSRETRFAPLAEDTDPTL